MKRISERTEIAAAVNFNKYPVLTIDLADADVYGLKGCSVRIDAGKFNDGTPYLIDAELRVYRDEKKLTLHANDTCLHNDFTYSDFYDMVENAQSPIIGADMDVVIAVFDSRTHQAYPLYLVHTGDRIDKFCSNPMKFEDVDMESFLLLTEKEKTM